MHAWERLTENALSKICKNMDEAMKFLIEWFAKLSNNSRVRAKGRKLDNVSFSKVKLSLKKSKEEENDFDTAISGYGEKTKFGMILYKDVSTILSLRELWMEDLNKHMKLLLLPELPPEEQHNFISEDEMNLWNALAEAWKVSHSNSEQLKKHQEENYKQAKMTLETLGKTWVACYNGQMSYPHYLHILVCHTLSMWQKFGSLCRLTNQSSESLNNKQPRIISNIGRHGGLGCSQMYDIILLQIKLLLYEHSKIMEEFENFLESVWEEDLRTRSRRTEVAEQQRSRPSDDMDISRDGSLPEPTAMLIDTG